MTGVVEDDGELGTGVEPDVGPNGHDREGGDAADEEPLEVPRRGQWALIIAGVLAVAAAGFLWVLATSGDSTDRRAYSALQGKEAPPVAGEALLDGRGFDIRDNRGQWVAVNFFATWCPPCVEEHPELRSFEEAHRGRGDATVVSVVFDDNLEDVENFFERHGGDWAVVPDPNGLISVDYGVIGVPETYLVDPEGVVRQKIIGGVTQAGLERIIAALESDLGSEAEADDGRPPETENEGATP